MMESRPQPKPFRTEYAKSGRATCNSCRNTIAQDSFRIATVVKATQFDGYMPVWHHASCLLKKPGKIKTVDEVEGIDNLRWEDHKRLRDYVEGKLLGVKEGNMTMASTNADAGADGEYAIETAKTGRATCKSCNEKIGKAQVRVSTMVSGDSGKFRGKVPAWRHVKCFMELGWWTQPVVELPGWDDLSDDDKAEVKKLVKPGSKSKVDPGEPSGKQKGTKRKKGEVDSAPSSRKMKGLGGQKKTVEDAKDVDTKRSDELEQQLEKQSTALWDIKDNLKKNVDTTELRMMLEENDQDLTGSEYDLRERCADGMLFGALAKCPMCGGFVEFFGGEYRCRGNISEWSKCTYTTTSPERVKGKWKMPIDLENSYLMKWSKSQKAKKEMRVLLPKPSVTKEGGESSKKNIEGGVQDGALKGLKAAFLGKSIKSKWKVLVEAAGGEILTTLRPGADCVITNEAELNLEENEDKLQKAMDLGVPVIKEDFLTDCLDRGTLVAFGRHTLEVPGKCASVVKVKVKGRSAVHEESGLQDAGHILEDGKTIYNTTLNLSDLSTGVNSYYVLQIVEHDSQNVYHLFRRWGRVGDARIGSYKLEKMSKSQAIQQFKKLFREKTGNDWESWESRVGFQKRPNKFFPLEIDYGIDSSLGVPKSLGTKSKLDSRVISLMKMLFDIETYKAVMMEFEINMSEMPLGKLSKRNIDQGFQVLTDIQNIFNSESSERRESLLVDASNRFFTLVPHVHPRIISTGEALKSKIEMLEALRDIEIASNLIGSTGEDTDEDPLDANYKKLNCRISPVPHNSDDFCLVEKYLQNTHASTHREWALEVEDVYTIDRQGEYEAYTPQKQKLGNRQLLWHGSRTTNFVGILSQGLRIAPPEAPVTGYMFGKGLYFADLVSKSAQYCYTSKSSPVGLMLLSEVALGEMYELKAAQYMEKPPPGKKSTKGLGRNKPLESEFEMWGDGVIVPCGHPVPSGVKNTSLLYNEYIVYDTAQVQLRFLLKVRFKHRH